MDCIVQKLVDFDHVCSTRVEEAKKLQLELTKDLKEQKDELYKQSLKEQEILLTDYKAKLIAEAQKQEKEKDEEFQITLSNLQKHYGKNKKQWIREIVQKCLK